MEIIAAAGLAQNFGALRSLVTTGIQKGHMKMHLLNILNQLGATKIEIEKIKDYFNDKVVEHSAVVNLFHELRKVNQENIITK
jgi:hydroxymethylglutaryl-CoA reductase